jgi:hypothetical protein
MDLDQVTVMDQMLLIVPSVQQMLTVIYITENAYVMTSGAEISAKSGEVSVPQPAPTDVLDHSPGTVTHVPPMHPIKMEPVYVIMDGTILRTAQNGLSPVTQPVIYVTAQSQLSAMSAKNTPSATPLVFVNVKTTGTLNPIAQHSIKPSVSQPVPNVMAQESMIVWTVSTTLNATLKESVSVTNTGELTTVPTSLDDVTIAVLMDVPDQLLSTVMDAPETTLRSTVNAYVPLTGLEKTVPSGTVSVTQPVWNVLAQQHTTVSAVLSTHGA